MRISRVSLFSVVVGVLSAGCNDPAPVQAHRSAVLIGDRGISIPLPPPSVLQAPQQEVEVHGELATAGGLTGEAEVRIVDVEGGDEASVPVEGGTFTAVLEVDLSAACLEAWVVDGDGSEGERRFYSTRIEADETIRVLEGCE